MPFPMSIDGRIQFEAGSVPAKLDIAARLQDSLVAETVEGVFLDGTTVTFRNGIGPRVSVARPGGARWQFAMFDRGNFVVRQEQGGSIRYQLSTRYAFWQTLGIALLFHVGLLLFGGSDGKVAGPVFAGFWCLVFVSGYNRASTSIRRWLNVPATAPVMPPPADLQYDDP